MLAKIALFTFCLGLAASTEFSARLPSFTWDPKHKSKHGVPLLIIHIDDGLPDDVALLKNTNPIPARPGEDVDDCIFRGHLKNEPNVTVALTGCPFSDTFQIQFNSQRLPDFSFISTNGTVVAPKSPTGRALYEEDVVVRPDSRFSLWNFISDSDFPPEGFELTLKIWYDPLFKAKHGDDSVNTLRRILVFMQEYFYWPSLQTTFQLNVVETVELPFALTNFASDESLNQVKPVIANTPEINAHVFFTYDDNMLDYTRGIAHLGRVCSVNTGLRASVNEYFESDIQTARIASHEVGHNLGMDHDFLEQEGQLRVDSQGNPCTGIHSLMDYNQDYYDKWSTCSVEDIRATYNHDTKNGARKWCVRTAGAAYEPADPNLLPMECEDKCLSYCATNNFAQYASCRVNVAGLVVQCPCSKFEH